MAIMSWLFLKFSDDFQFESNLGQSGRKNQFVIKKKFQTLIFGAVLIGPVHALTYNTN